MKNNEYVPKGVRLPPEMEKEIKDIASKKFWNDSQVMREAMRLGLLEIKKAS